MPHQVQEQVQLNLPLLDQRFAKIKKSLVKPENKQKVIESYDRLLKVLKSEADLIEKNGPAMIPEIDFDEVRKNGGKLPDAFADLVRDRGCCILRNVVPEEQAVKWETDLGDYTKRHRSIGGFPEDNPQNWSLWWTPSQVEIRSHPKVLEAMNCVSQLWHTEDPSMPVDLASQVVYPDRFRIRYPSKDAEYTLPWHVDSGAIERWEDEENRSNYQAIFDGNWQNWDGWVADRRIEAKSNMYEDRALGACSCWRSLQGWLSLSHTGTGEGTIRLLPSLKASVAYMMLRPLFTAGSGDGEWDDSQPTFPGSQPGNTQFLPNKEMHPHLDLDRSVVGIPPVRPGDYVFWHCDLIHEVDKYHPGTRNSSVVYNACNPLTPYNIKSLIGVRDAFQNGRRPKDFDSYLVTQEIEAHHSDNGAKKEYILSDQGLRAMGLKAFNVDEEGLTEGQKKVRKLANEALGLS